VSAFRVHLGKVHFKQRYVRTEKFMREREAQRALIGKFAQWRGSHLNGSDGIVRR